MGTVQNLVMRFPDARPIRKMPSPGGSRRTDPECSQMGITTLRLENRLSSIERG
jgi:hypothetical protein